MLVVPLKIVAPIDITTQPVTLGVPFPRGVLRDPATLRLFDDAGTPVLLQTTTLAKWVDGSVRWLLVDFLIEKTQKGDHGWLLRDNMDEKSSLTGQMTLLAESDQIQLNTGQIECWLSQHYQRIEICPVGGSTGQCWWSIDLDPFFVDTWGFPRTTSQGPVRTTTYIQDYFARRDHHAEIMFFGGTGLVRLRLTIRNPKRATHPDGLWDLGDKRSIDVKDRGVLLACPNHPELQWVTEPGLSAESVTGSAFQIMQASSGGLNWESRVHVGKEGQVRLPFRGYKVEQERTEKHGLRASPIVVASSGQHSVTLALPEFWQHFPKAITCIPIPENWEEFPQVTTGKEKFLAITLFPDQAGEACELQGGEQKTHTIWFHFGPTSGAELELQWVHQPALVQVAPEWVERCGVLPFFPTSIAPDVAGERFAALMRDAVEGPDSFFAKRERIDEYGWRNYGELYADHENEHYPGPKPVVSHYNNQYDALNGLLMQYFRTGDPRWWQLADPLARHIYDIDIYHTNQDRPAYNGGLFWHTDHYRDAATATHRTYGKANKPPGKAYGGGPGNEHNWSTGLLNYYYLTGDPLAREAVLSLANWVINRDDGAKTFLGLIDDGPTGLASGTGGDGSYHGPGRGGGNSINALLDGWLLTDKRRYLDKAEELIRRCIHPADDLDALDMGNPEERWSYTVFLSVIARYLELKRQADQVDERYAYARAALLHYARWMVKNEKPYFDQVERLEFPNETWAAQEMRKANVLRLAARYAEELDRSAMLKRGEELSDRAWHDIYRFESRTSTRSLAILMTEGLRDSYLRTHAEERVSETGPATDFGSPMNFVPQRTRVKRQLTSVSGVLKAIPRLLNPVRWWRACRTRQFW